MDDYYSNIEHNCACKISRGYAKPIDFEMELLQKQ
jgi:hypothetical protein